MDQRDPWHQDVQNDPLCQEDQRDQRDPGIKKNASLIKNKMKRINNAQICASDLTLLTDHYIPLGQRDQQNQRDLSHQEYPEGKRENVLLKFDLDVIKCIPSFVR